MNGESTTSKNGWESLVAPAAMPMTDVAAKARVVRRLTPPAGRDRAGEPQPEHKRGANDKLLQIVLVAGPGLFADGLARALRDLGQPVHVVQSTPSKAVASARDADLVLVDLDAAGHEPDRLVAGLRNQLSAPLVAMAGAEDAALMGKMLAAGAAAFLAKSEPTAQALELLRTVLRRSGRWDDCQDAAAAGREPAARTGDAGGTKASPYGLTAAQLRILALLAEGLSNQAIAKRRGICEGTVKIHLNAIYQKLGVQSRTQAARIAQRLDAVIDVQMERASDGRALLDWLLPYMTSEARQAGDLLFKRGDPGDTLYFVQQGKIRLSEIETEVKDGELLGEVGVFAPGHRRTCTARCAADTRLFRLTSEQVKRLYFENPEFAFHLMQLVAQRLTVDRERLGMD